MGVGARSRGGALVTWALVAGLCAALLGPGGAAAADPLAATEDWLPRVVTPGLAPPSAPIPPIAIIEQGFDPEHPEMQGGWVSMRRPSPRPDLTNEQQVQDFASSIAHGTEIASIIGAPRDGIGMEGLLPGARVRVYGNSLACRDMARAIRQAVDEGARVISASYGFTSAGACRAHHDATSYAFGRGALVVAAAGNGRPSQPSIQPGNDYHVLTVAALTAADQPTGFSYQNVYVDLAAPGEGVLAATPVWWDTLDGVPDGYSRVDGTSFSAPLVAAAAAWVMARRPQLTPDQVAEVLRRSARDLQRPGWDISTGWGAVDLAAALRQPAPPTDPDEPNDDIRWLDGRAGLPRVPPLLRQGTSESITARLDSLKDPLDVYPAWVPPRGAVAIRVTPTGMPMDLFVWQPGTRTTRAGSAGAVTSSRRPGLRPDEVRIVNRSGRGARIWVEVRRVRARALSGGYTLGLKRVPII
jgi:subtilisin family serine protease